MTHRRRRPAIAVEVLARQRRVLEALLRGTSAEQRDRALAVAAEMDTAEVEAGARAPGPPDQRRRASA